MKNSYPKVLFSYELGHIIKSKPTLLKKPGKPEKPELSSKQVFKKPEEVPEDTIGCFGYGFIAMLISGLGVLLFNAGLTVGGFLVPIGGLMMMYYTFGWETIKRNRQKKRDLYLKNLKEYEENKRNSESEYKNKLIEYNSKNESYDNDCKKVESRNIEMQSENFLFAFKKQKIKSYLLESKQPKQFRGLPQRSVTHNFFKEYLSKKFPNQIFDNFYFKNSDYENLLYIPDYVLYDKEINLFFNIEVDEPYIGIDGTPIHFQKSNDEERDDFFLRKKWIVIRFAEIQIIRNPNMCCGIIENVIKNLKSCILKDDFSDNSQIQIIEKWSKEDAHKLAFQKYRNIYLPLDLQENLRLEKLENDRSNLNPKRIYYDDLPF